MGVGRDEWGGVFRRTMEAVSVCGLLLCTASQLVGQAPVEAPASAAASESGEVVEDFAAVRDRIGPIWIRAVDDESAVPAGLDTLAVMRASGGPSLSSEAQRLVLAYEGSFMALRAKHGGGPRARLRDLKEGFERMDAAVSASPDAAELRYIRLMSGFYLPRLFGRREAVREDLSALARVLPESDDRFPPGLYAVVVDFVLEHGDLDPATRAMLESLAR